MSAATNSMPMSPARQFAWADAARDVRAGATATARLVVTQPRLPCFKLGIRFGDPAMVKAFLKASWPGIYFAVAEEGEVGPGDSIEQIHTDERRITVVEMFGVMLNRHSAPDDLRRLLEVPALATVWREEFQDRLGE